MKTNPSVLFASILTLAAAATAQDVARLRVGAVSFEAPAGWTIVNESADGALLNPGFAPTDTLDALVIVMHGELEADEQGAPLTQVVRDRLPDLASELRDQAIVVDFDGAKPRVVKTASGDGVVVEAAGRANDARDVKVWLGVARNGATFAVVLGVLTVERASNFLPPLARVHATMSFVEPSGGEAELAGSEFGHSSIGSGGNSLTTVYTFGAAGQVTRRTMFSSSIGGSDRSVGGRWTVDGDTVTMTFADGTTTARLVGSNGEISALQIGATRYAKT